MCGLYFLASLHVLYADLVSTITRKLGIGSIPSTVFVAVAFCAVAVLFIAVSFSSDFSELIL